MPIVRTRNSVQLLFAALVWHAVPCSAQQVANSSERVMLESRFAQAESAAKRDSEGTSSRAERLAEAAAIRARLRDGDFHPGDRITLWVNGEAALSNTYTVRAGNVLEIPTLHEISLCGVLRSELTDVLLREIGRYIRHPEIRVSALMNVAVLGAVSRPGFYSVAPDAPITEVVMSAGGPGGNADFARSRILRGDVVIADPLRLRRMLDENSTLEDIGLQSGDRIVIGERTHHWQTISAVIGTLTLVTTSVVLLGHR